MRQESGCASLNFSPWRLYTVCRVPLVHIFCVGRKQTLGRSYHGLTNGCSLSSAANTDWQTSSKPPQKKVNSLETSLPFKWNQAQQFPWLPWRGNSGPLCHLTDTGILPGFCPFHYDHDCPKAFVTPCSKLFWLNEGSRDKRPKNQLSPSPANACNPQCLQLSTLLELGTRKQNHIQIKGFCGLILNDKTHK